MGHLNGHIVHDTQHHIGRHLLQTDRCGFKQNLAQNPWLKFWHEHAQIIDTVVKRKKEYKIGLIPPYLMRSNRMLPCRCFEDTLSPDGWEVDPHMKLMSCLVQKTTFALSKSLVVVGTGFEGYWPPLWFERRFLCVWVQPKKKHGSVCTKNTRNWFLTHILEKITTKKILHRKQKSKEPQRTSPTHMMNHPQNEMCGWDRHPFVMKDAPWVCIACKAMPLPLKILITSYPNIIMMVTTLKPHKNYTSNHKHYTFSPVVKWHSFPQLTNLSAAPKCYHTPP